MERWSEIRDIYREHPMQNGDVALVTDLRVVTEMQALADTWDPRRRRDVVRVLREAGVAELLVAIARPGGQLLPQDHALWADLREELAGTGIRLFPLEALPGREIRAA